MFHLNSENELIHNVSIMFLIQSKPVLIKVLILLCFLIKNVGIYIVFETVITNISLKIFKYKI